jgi:hypothetical protein
MQSREEIERDLILYVTRTQRGWMGHADLDSGNGTTIATVGPFLSRRYAFITLEKATEEYVDSLIDAETKVDDPVIEFDGRRIRQSEADHIAETQSDLERETHEA